MLPTRKMLTCSLTQAVSQEGRPSALSTHPSCQRRLGKSECCELATIMYMLNVCNVESWEDLRDKAVYLP